MKIRLYGSILILKNNKVLLLHHPAKYKNLNKEHNSDIWSLPIDEINNESIEESAIKQVKKEINLDISNIEIFDADDEFSDNVHLVNLYIHAKKINGEINIENNDSIDQYEWFKLESLPDNISKLSEKAVKVYKIKRDDWYEKIKEKYDL